MTVSTRTWIGTGIGLAGLLACAVWLDRQTAWVTPAFDAVSRMFHEIPVTAPVVTLAQLRRSSQLNLVRVHGTILITLVSLGCLIAPWLTAHTRRLWAIFCVGYTVRAIIWIVGGNLPLVPGDSCHYLEVASSVVRGEGPVKHYVESFFRDYPAIREGRGVLDDWATPLDAYVLGAAFRVTGVEPGRSLEPTVAVAKGLSFILSLLALPALYGFARRRFGGDVALGAAAILAVLPVHAIYAGFELRESLVALTSILAVWFLTEIWSAGGKAGAPADVGREAGKASSGARGSPWAWAVAAGLGGGLAILARNTALALLAAAGLYGLVVHGRRVLGPLLLWGVIVVAMIAPWAWATFQEYGRPFYSYTDYFEYNFSWTVHHFAQGNTRAAEFYTKANAPEIIRVKIKSLLIIAAYVTMIFSLPLLAAFLRRLRRPSPVDPPGARDTDRLVAAIAMVFALATLARIADITQVTQLGRYYLPVFVLALPTAAAGVRDWLSANAIAPRARPWLAATLVALLWADPTWAYDATWFVKPYQLHWPALRAAGDWMKEHPDAVPENARIMTWFPWELRIASARTTILMPRNFDARRIDEVIRQYGVTHVLWGSFEPPPDSDPELLGPSLDRLRIACGWTDSRELYRTPSAPGRPPIPYGVRLYRLR
jgi:4-amino-4-deoxy-L-arabinose transferase-like glycosyltransferase